MKKYLVTLTPTGRFFFGGDMTFSVGDKEKEENKDRKAHNEKFSSYIIHSSKFPQQTSLLGMLRFLLLSNDEVAFNKETQTVVDKKKAAYLIGEKSFSVNLSDHKENNFGCIHGIGPCFLYDMNGRKEFYPAPVDLSLTVNKSEEKVKATLNGQILEIPEILKDGKGYTSKMELKEEYISVKDGKIEILKNDDVFKEDERIGISKQENGKTENDAFYKQVGYKMAQPHWVFAFTVEIENRDLTNYNKQLVALGADSSMFVFNAVQQNNRETLKMDLLGDRYPLPGSDWKRVVLQSDTYLIKEDLECVKYAICSTKPFRFLSFTLETKNYNVMGNVNMRSSRYNLYKAGSVFFLDKPDADDFMDKIKEKKEFYQIGYNHYYH